MIINILVIASRLDDDGGEGDDTVYYILMRAAEEFYTEYSRYPGWYDDQVEADIPLLKVCFQTHCHRYTGMLRVSLHQKDTQNVPDCVYLPNMI